MQTTDTFLCPESPSLVYRLTHFTDTGYLRTVYFQCMLIVNIVSCSNNERFLQINMSVLLWWFNKAFFLLLHTFHFVSFSLSVIAPWYLYIDKKCVRDIFSESPG